MRKAHAASVIILSLATVSSGGTDARAFTPLEYHFFAIAIAAIAAIQSVVHCRRRTVNVSARGANHRWCRAVLGTADWRQLYNLCNTVLGLVWWLVEVVLRVAIVARDAVFEVVPRVAIVARDAVFEVMPRVAIGPAMRFSK